MQTEIAWFTFDPGVSSIETRYATVKSLGSAMLRREAMTNTMLYICARLIHRTIRPRPVENMSYVGMCVRYAPWVQRKFTGLFHPAHSSMPPVSMGV